MFWKPILNHEAEDAYSALRVEVRKDFVDYLSSSASNKAISAASRRELTRQLTNAGILWQPIGDVRLRPAPWAARAFLRGSEEIDVRRRIHPLLKASLVCAPLAREIVSHCFDLESRVRSAHGTLGIGRPVSDQCRNLWKRFQAEDPDSEVRYYPKDCPAWPDNESELASFGEFLNTIKPFYCEEHHFSLLKLRNALAHGHYVSWHVIRELRHIEKMERT